MHGTAGVNAVTVELQMPVHHFLFAENIERATPGGIAQRADQLGMVDHPRMQAARASASSGRKFQPRVADDFPVRPAR